MNEIGKPIEPRPVSADTQPDDKSDLIHRMRERGHRRTATSGKVPAVEQVGNAGGSAESMEADLERELDEAMAGFDAEQFMAEKGTRGKPADSKKIGKVFRIHGPDVFIDLPGGRSQGVLPMLQFPDGPPALGTEVEVSIEGFDNASGVLLLTRKGGVVEAEWGTIETGQTVEARVTGINKGGLEVSVNGIRGFMPISQIDLYRVEDLEQYVNQKLLCAIVEADRAEKNLVVSRRDLLEKEREVKREKTWADLAEGQTHEGIVRSVKDFGAFVDIGGVDGLVHVGEMSWTRVKNAADVVQPGQTVRVIVLKIDREARKVGLGMKQLTASPWDDVAEKYPINSVVAGKVSRIENYGAFVELEPAIEGLIHISELSPKRVNRVIDVVRSGQDVTVAVLSVDREQRRIGLSLKAALPKEYEPEPATAAVTESAVPLPPPKPAKPRTTPLRGGLGAPFQLPPLGGQKPN